MESHDLGLRVQRLQRMLTLALILALLPWFAIGAAAWYWTRARVELPGTLSVRALEVRSQDGQTLAELGASARLGGALRVSNAQGREVVYLGGEPAGSGNLSLRAKDGKLLVVARDNDGHRGSVTAYGPSEKPLAFLGGGSREDGVLQTWNAAGATIASLGTNQFGQPFLQLLAKDGHTAFELGTRAEGQTDLVLYGPNAQAGATLAAEAQGGRCALFDAHGGERLRAGCCSEHDLACFSIDDAAGQTVAVLGQNHDHAGGFFRAFAPGEHAVFYAGVGDREGSGRISLYRPSGRRLFLAALAHDGSGGSVSLSDSDGEVAHESPADGPFGAK